VHGELPRGHRVRGIAVAFSPDGRLLPGGLDRVMLGWEGRAPRDNSVGALGMRCREGADQFLSGRRGISRQNFGAMAGTGGDEREAGQGLGDSSFGVSVSARCGLRLSCVCRSTRRART
jgi:hypothetical protein